MKKLTSAILILTFVFIMGAGASVAYVQAEEPISLNGSDEQDMYYRNDYGDFSEFLDADVWYDEIEGETAPTSQTLFQGAWFHRAVSSVDNWLGVEGTITLPEVQQDVERLNPDSMSFLDHPSIYMGINAGAESDVGLTFATICEDNKTDPVTLSAQARAFRPFWRYITKAGNNIWENVDKFYYEMYFFPGDTIRMAIMGKRAGYVSFSCELISPTTIPKYVGMRERYEIPSNLIFFFATEFESPDFLVNPCYCKQVNAIDQASNEGKPTAPSETMVTGAVWQSSYLYRRINGTVYKVPFNKNRYTLMSAPVAEGFATYEDQVANMLTGYRTVDILPGQAVNYNP